MILTIGLSYRPCWIIQKSQKCLFEWSKQPKMRFLAIFLSFVHRIDLKLHIFILLNDVDSWAVISLVLDHSKITKIPFWVIQRAKNDVFDHYLEFGLLVRLDIAYYETTTCLTTLIVTRSRIIIQKPRKCIFDQSKGSKKGFCQFQGLWSVGSSSNWILW